jgi:hypothetical protein
MQSGPDTTVRRSARDLQQPKYGAMHYTVFQKFNHWCVFAPGKGYSQITCAVEPVAGCRIVRITHD